jgi:hypothetical protein
MPNTPEIPHHSQAPELLGALRNKLIERRLMGASRRERRLFSPDYTPEDFKKALTLANYLQLFLEAGISAMDLLTYFNTPEGLNFLQNVLTQSKFAEGMASGHDIQEFIRKYILDREVKNFVNIILRDPNLFEWVASEQPALEKPQVPQNENAYQVSERRKFMVAAWLSTLQDRLLKLMDLGFFTKFFSRQNPFQQELIKEIPFTHLLEEINRNWLSRYRHELSHQETKRGSELLLFHFQARQEFAARWSDRLANLDFLSYEFLPWPSTGFLQLEHQLAQHYAQFHAGVPLGLNQYLQDGRTFAGAARNDIDRSEHIQLRRNVSPDENREALRKIEPQKYRWADHLEDYRHPLNYLHTYGGVEAEVRYTPQVDRELYDLLGKYVTEKGTGADIEISLRPVKHSEVLIAIYQKLFESGAIDLLQMTDFSLHWNSGLKSKTLMTETLAILLLTGKLSQGRVAKGAEKVGIGNTLFAHMSEYGDDVRLEWKQGDLIHPETFYYGCQIWEAMRNAQAAYEVVGKKAFLKNLRGKNPHVEMWAKKWGEEEFESFCEEHVLQREELFDPELEDVTEEQRKLAFIYASVRVSARTFLDDLSARSRENFLTSSILKGKVEGMVTSAQWLLAALPTFKDMLQTDVTAELKRSRRIDEKEIQDDSIQAAWNAHRTALEAVSFMNELARDTLHQVNQVMGEAEELYHRWAVESAVAVLVNNKSLIRATYTKLTSRFPLILPPPKGHPLLSKGSPEMENPPEKVTQIVSLRKLSERYKWLIEDSKVSQKDKTVLQKAKNLIDQLNLNESLL